MGFRADAVSHASHGSVGGTPGVVVHGFLETVYRFAGVHALCNAHLLRDLTQVTETTQDARARRLQTLLGDMHRVAETARDAGQAEIVAPVRTSYRALYDLYGGSGAAVPRARVPTRSTATTQTDFHPKIYCVD